MRMLYLASNSPRRKKLLYSQGIQFRFLKPLYKEEDNSSSSNPAKQVQRHALGKALSVSNKITQGLVLGADTVVYYRGRILGKPGSLRKAVGMLSMLEGRRHTVFTGVALLWVMQGRIKKRKVFIERTEVYLKKMTVDEIRRYFRRINPLDKAGAYAIQSKRLDIVAKIRGSFSNAVGLPMERLLEIPGIYH